MVVRLEHNRRASFACRNESVTTSQISFRERWLLFGEPEDDLREEPPSYVVLLGVRYREGTRTKPIALRAVYVSAASIKYGML